MSNMITSLREKVDDLNLSLDAKDEIISNYENYIDDMKKKMAGQVSSQPRSQALSISHPLHGREEDRAWERG